MRRGFVTKKKSRLLTVWVPESLVPLIDRGVAITDTDRSKFVRNALRDKLVGLGLVLPAIPKGEV